MAQEVLAKHSGWGKSPSRCFANVNFVYLKEWQFIVSPLERLEIHNQGAGRALVPLKALGEDFPSLLPSSGGCWQSLLFPGLQLDHSSVCLCLGFMPFSYRDTRVLGARLPSQPLSNVGIPISAPIFLGQPRRCFGVFLDNLWKRLKNSFWSNQDKQGN